MEGAEGGNRGEQGESCLVRGPCEKAEVNSTSRQGAKERVEEINTAGRWCCCHKSQHLEGRGRWISGSLRSTGRFRTARITQRNHLEKTNKQTQKRKEINMFLVF